jgi:hypothetical protein
MLQEYSHEFVEKIRDLHFEIRNTATEQMRYARKMQSEHLSQPYDSSFGQELFENIFDGSAGDTVYRIDVGAEEVLDRFCEKWGKELPLVVISEATGRAAYPKGVKEKDCKVVFIIDVIDGTRPLMYDLDSAYSLSGIAPNHGYETSLKDIEIAVQTEIPTTRQFLADFMYAVKGKGSVIEEWDVLNNTKLEERSPSPTQSRDIRNGFAMMVKFFRGKDIAADMEEEIFREILGPIEYGKADVFDHQYISSGGQLAHLINGRYRFVADIRPWTEEILNKRGDALGLCAKPYDLCTKTIAEEEGIIITDLGGNPLDTPLDNKTNVGWIGYANQYIRDLVEKPLLRMMREYETR